MSRAILNEIDRKFSNFLHNTGNKSMDKPVCTKVISIMMFLIMVIFVLPDNTFAHKVTVFAWVEGDTVYTESKFSGGRKAKNTPIEVMDGQGKKILEGKTDENGKFSFKVPQKSEMKIVLLAGMGHQGEWTILIEEFEEETAEQSEKQTPYKGGAIKPDKIIKTDITSEENTGTSPCITSEDIQNLVEKTLDKKLNPVISKLNKLSDQDHGPGVSDIFGGIGYILGLVGIGAYFNYRNKKKDASQP